MPSKFQYQPRSQDAWTKRESGKSYDGFIKDGIETYSPKKDNWIRILPPTWDNPTHYGLDIWVHYSVGPNRGSVLCLKRMQNQPCPLCEAQSRAEAAGREQDVSQLKPTPRVLAWIVDRHEKEKKVPKAWAMPKTKVDLEICQICRDRITGELYMIDDPSNGYDLTFGKEGEMLTTNYTGFQLARRPTTVEDEYLNYILDHPLPTILNWRTYEEVQTLFEGAFPVTSTVPGQEAFQSAPEPTQQVQSTAQAIYTPPPPPPVQITNFPPQGWTAHPSAPGFYYAGQEVLSESDLRARYTPPPPPVVVAPPPPPPPVAAVPAAPQVNTAPVVQMPQHVAQPASPTNSGATSDAASRLRARFNTGK